MTSRTSGPMVMSVTRSSPHSRMTKTPERPGRPSRPSYLLRFRRVASLIGDHSMYVLSEQVFGRGQELPACESWVSTPV